MHASAEPLVALVGAGPGNPGLLTIRAVECLARADLVLRVNEFLSDEDLKTFKTAVDRLPSFPGRPGGPGGPGGRPPFRRPAP